MDAVRFGPDGLTPAVVQDRSDGRVLMVGYLDAEALEATLASGEVHFHSRSRGRLWRKGETSGHVLRLREMEVDCDGDALLLVVDPLGPTCHRGTRSCFDGGDVSATAGWSVDGEATRDAGAQRADGGGAWAAGGGARADGAIGAGSVREQGFDWLESLWATIVARAEQRPAASYTAALLEAGVDEAARKVGEEAIEVVIAAKDDAAAQTAGRDHVAAHAALAGELADLVYHALVLIAERDMTPADVIEVLRARAR